jgi:hypothetical protein
MGFCIGLNEEHNNVSDADYEDEKTYYYLRVSLFVYYLFHSTQWLCRLEKRRL